MTRPAYYDWVATRTIYLNGARAFVKGSLVPDSTVSAYGWDVDGTVVAATPPPDPLTPTSTTMIVSVGEVQ